MSFPGHFLVKMRLPQPATRDEWLALVKLCWGERAHLIGTAGASPAFQVVE